MAEKDETTLAGVACHCKELCAKCSCKTSINPLKNQSDHRARVAAALLKFHRRQSEALSYPSQKKLGAESGTLLAFKNAEGGSDD